MTLIADVAAPVWREAEGGHRLLGRSTPIRDCEAHFHETYIIAFIKGGRATAWINGVAIALVPGLALLLNPFDIVECASEPDFDYDVCYPDKAFMDEALLRVCGRVGTPRFVRPDHCGPVAVRFGATLATLCSGDPDPSTGQVEHQILDLFGSTPALLSISSVQPLPVVVARACELIDQLIEEPITVAEISARVNRSRSHLARVFTEAVGVPPNIYIRQLRLARALGRIRSGEPLADVAIAFGFFDQAHFTREFKRVYGTSPGRLARDITRCRQCH